MLFVNVRKESLRSIVSQLAAVDDFSIRCLGKGGLIRESLNEKSFSSSFLRITYYGLNLLRVQRYSKRNKNQN